MKLVYNGELFSPLRFGVLLNLVLNFVGSRVINDRVVAIENSLNVDEKLMVYPPSCRQTFLFSGVLILVLVYTVMGTILFVSLEGDLDEMDGIETAASKPYPRNNDMIYAELRTR